MFHSIWLNAHFAWLIFLFTIDFWLWNIPIGCLTKFQIQPYIYTECPCFILLFVLCQCWSTLVCSWVSLLIILCSLPNVNYPPLSALSVLPYCSMFFAMGAPPSVDLVFDDATLCYLRCGQMQQVRSSSHSVSGEGASWPSPPITSSTTTSTGQTSTTHYQKMYLYWLHVKCLVFTISQFNNCYKYIHIQLYP